MLGGAFRKTLFIPWMLLKCIGKEYIRIIIFIGLIVLGWNNNDIYQKG